MHRRPCAAVWRPGFSKGVLTEEDSHQREGYSPGSKALMDYIMRIVDYGFGIVHASTYAFDPQFAARITD